MPRSPSPVLLLWAAVACTPDAEPQDKDGSPPDTAPPPDGADSGEPADPGDSGDCVPATFYRDADGDGAGDPAHPVEACDRPADHVDDATDCDDTRPDVHPGAPEVCDDADTDEDCDGLVDDADDSVDPTTQVRAHADADGDGFGHPEPTVACDLPAGTWTDDATDCDDTAATTHPGAEELCGDTVDNDCDGGLDEGCAPSSLSDATVHIAGAGDSFGWHVAGADLTGDGIADLVVGTSGAGADYEGAVRVFQGPLVGQLTAADAVGTIEGTVSEGALGYSVETTADADGDGVPDLLLGALGLGGSTASSPGTAYLVTDVPTGTLSVPSDARAWFVGADLGANAGAHADDVGDLDADGVIDFAIGAGQAHDLGGSTGQVYVLHGPVSGAYALGTDADVVLYADDWGGGMGDWISSGDVTGDGQSDLVLPANSSHASGTVSGAVFVVSDPPDGVFVVDQDADATVAGTTYTGFGQVSALADLTGDGYLDLATSDGTIPGTVYVIAGPLSGDHHAASAHATYTGLGTYLLDRTGWALDRTDLDHDGAFDLAIGSPHVDTTSTGPGVVDVFYGPLPTGTHSLTAADVSIPGTGTDALGTGVAALPDVTGDGLDELAVTSPYRDAGAGAIWLFQ